MTRLFLAHIETAVYHAAAFSVCFIVAMWVLQLLGGTIHLEDLLLV